MYTYLVKILKVIDGDTIDVLIDLGFSIWVKQRIRFANINAPEIKGKEKRKGLKAKKFVENQLKESKLIKLKIFKMKKGKYGRYIANVYFYDGVFWRNLNDILVSKKLAKYVEY